MLDRLTRNGRRAALAIGAAFVLALAGCGGDGAGAGGSAGTGAGGSTSVTDITLFSDKASLPATDGTTSATVTAQVKDAQNNVVANQQVRFTTTDAGVSLTPLSTNGLTDSSGRATLKVDLAPGATGRTNREVEIVATTGAVARSMKVSVAGTRVTLVGPDTIAEGGSADYVITVLDAVNAAVVGAPVSVSFDLGTVSPASVNTGTNGQAAVRVTATKPGPAGKIVVSALGLSPEKAVTILSTSSPFAFSTPVSNASLDVGADHTVTIRFQKAGVPMSGRPVTMSTTRGEFVPSNSPSVTVTTNASGDAVATLRSRAAGQATLSALVADGTGMLSTSTNVAMVSRVPAKLSLSPSPSSISANAINSSSSTSQLVATVRDANDNPVQGAQIAFSAIDPSSGRIEPGIAVTGADGQASASFIAGPNSTGPGAIKVTASVVPVTAPPIADTKEMTVSQAALFIELGTGNQITEVGSTAYSMPWDAIVTDANRNPVVGAAVAVSLEAVQYYKGVWVHQGAWTPVQFDDRSRPPVACRSEDVPQPGSLKPNNLLDAGEDRNGNGKLDPGSPAAVLVTSAGGVTGANGLATLEIIYPKSFGQWVDVMLRVTIATAGTESSVTRSFLLPVLADDVKEVDVAPPNVGARLPVDVDPGPAGAPMRSLVGPNGYETAVDGEGFCISPN